jgi:hypothetical protein
MKIQKLRWMAVRAWVLSEVPDAFKHRVAMPSEAHGFRVEIDGEPLTSVYAFGEGVAIDNRASFRFGTDKRGHQMQDLQRELQNVVFSALGLRLGYCGNWGHADGTRLDGKGLLQRTPIEEALEAIEALERAEAEGAAST